MDELISRHLTHYLHPSPDEPSPDYSFQSQLLVPNQTVNPDSSPETSPVRPLPRSASSANLQSASKLILSSKLVYSKRLDLPHGVEVTRATPSAGGNLCFYAGIKKIKFTLRRGFERGDFSWFS